MYVPNEDARVSQKEIRRRTPGVVKIITGDLSAYVGNVINSPIKDQFREESLNENGPRLISFCNLNNLQILPSNIKISVCTIGTRTLEPVVDYFITKHSQLRFENVRCKRG